MLGPAFLEPNLFKGTKFCFSSDRSVLNLSLVSLPASQKSLKCSFKQTFTTVIGRECVLHSSLDKIRGI